MVRRLTSSIGVRLLLVTAPAAALAAPSSLLAQKGKVTPGYALYTLAAPPGAARPTAIAMNDSHEIVGADSPNRHSARALYWASVDAAPVFLPCLADPCSSVAAAINAQGVIAGHSNNLAVVWRPNGAGWTVEPLPFPGSGDPDYLSRINALLDDGAGAGYYTLYYGLMYPNDIPVRWYSSGALTEFPVPDGYFAGRANATNENGDASGSLYMNDGTDPTYIYGVIWVQEGGSYQSLILTSMVGAMTPRFADGSFLVASSAGRLRVARSASGWDYTVDPTSAGPGSAINRLGDMVGHQPKKGWTGYGGVPYLLQFDGTLIKLPLPSGATGGTSSVTTDRWVAGNYLKLGTYYPAVWRPLQ